MNTVTLCADGRFFDRQTPFSQDPLMLLGYGLKLDAECTLRTYFRMLAQYDVLMRLNPFFPACLDEYHGCPASGCTDDGLDAVVLTKTVEMVGFPGEPRMDIYNSLMGRSQEQMCELKSIPQAGMLDLPLELGRLRHVVFGDRVDVFTFDTVYTVFEFIDAVVWNLSFHGTLKACELRR